MADSNQIGEGLPDGSGSRPVREAMRAGGRYNVQPVQEPGTVPAFIAPASCNYMAEQEKNRWHAGTVL